MRKQETEKRKKPQDQEKQDFLHNPATLIAIAHAVVLVVAAIMGSDAKMVKRK